MMVELDKEIENLRKISLDNVKALAKSYNKNRAIASGVKSSFDNKALNMPTKISEQIELEYQLGLKQGLFKMLSEKKEEAAISRASYVSTSETLEKARPVLQPATPKSFNVKLIGVLLGLIVPILFIFIKDGLNNKIDSRNDIERISNAPILGEISHSNVSEKLLVTPTARTLISEQFRMIRTNLEYITDKNKKAIILVTSSFGSEGKSFLTTNLGAAIALTDKKTVILEFDMRKPGIVKGLNLNRSKIKGISNYIVSDVSIDELLIPLPELDNFYVLPCGPIPPNPSELLLRDKTRKLFEELKEKFDYILIDSAPVGVVGDAITLGKFADCTIFMTRQRQTLKRQMKFIDELYVNNRLPNIGIVLNDVDFKGRYYSNYGYGNYGYYTQAQANGYYEQDVKTKTWMEQTFGRLNPKSWFNKK